LRFFFLDLGTGMGQATKDRQTTDTATDQ